MSIINIARDPSIDQPAVETKGRWLALISFLVLITALNMSATSVNLTIVPISKQMDAGLKVLQWVLSVYGLAWSVFVIPSGKLANNFGKKRMLIIGILIFIGSSLLCGFSEEVWLLILGRVIQGIAAAICIPPIYGLVYDKFPAGQRGFPIGLLGTGTGVGLAIGPTIGGIILEYLNWQWIYYINIPIGILAFLIILITIRKESTQLSKSLDIISSLYVALFVIPFSYGINNVSTWGLLDYKTFIAIALVIGGVLLFNFRSKKISSPLIPKGTFSNKLYVSTLTGFMFLSFILGTVLVIIGLYMQSVLNFSALHTALIFIGFAAIFSFVSPIGGKLSEKLDSRIPACIGICVAMIGVILVSFYNIQTNDIFIIISLCLVGFIGLSIAPYNTTMLKAVNKQTVDSLSGLYNMCGCMGFSIGVVISTNVLVHVSKGELTKLLHNADIILSKKSIQILEHLLESAHRDYQHLSSIQAPKEELIRIMNEAFITGLHTSMYVLLGVGLISVLITLKWMKVPQSKI